MYFISGENRNNKLKLEYNIFGEGPLKIVVLSHILGSYKIWKNHINFIIKNYPQYQVACFHYRGVENSEFKPSSNGIRDFSLDLLDFINHLNWDKVHLIGTSLGAQVAYDFALHSPQRVNSILFSSLKAPNNNYIETSTLVKNSFKNKDLELFEKVLFSNDFLNLITSDGTSVRSKIKNSLIQQLDEIAHKNDVIDDVFNATMSFKISDDDEINLKKRDFPISILCGNDDIVYPMVDQLKLLKVVEPEVFSILKGCGHGVQNERVHDFSTEIIKTLNLKRDSQNSQINIYKNIFKNDDNKNEKDIISYKIKNKYINNIILELNNNTTINNSSKVLKILKKLKR